MSAVIEARAELISTNPADGSEVGRVQISSPEEVSGAVAHGRDVFERWKRTSFAERKRLVMRAREVILGEMDDIALLISQESGKPVAEALSLEIAPVLDLMQWIARSAEKMLRPRRIGIGIFALMGRSSRVVYHPLGVIGIIPAWNYPFSIPLGEAVMAVMAGNTVVIKPSELTPLVGLKIGEIFEKAGFPPNVVQIVSGAGETGAALVAAPPDKIVFTGSTATGKKIQAAAAENLTPAVLELGGKDPMIVFDDANVELAAGAAVWGAFCNSGQNCSAVERLYVQEGIADELTKKIIEKTLELKQGPGDLEDVSVAAMSSERQIRIVERHVDDFREAGAEVLVGGKRAEIEGQENDGQNLFFQPTVISGATNDMRPMREETFGPLLPICTFKTEEEAIALANDGDYGLTASVWTRDYAKARRVARQIEAGTVCINEVLYTHGIGQTPWGGFKNSGLGRTHGLEGLMELVKPQHIHTNRIALLPDAWWMPYSPIAVRTFRQFATKFATGSLIKTAGMLPQLLKRIKELKKKSG
ncbi:MAG TPA: aldehyde dehydrogenase family protein [Pyrinomonadaceae bacterium]|nr:aldehyde dehydrogenase family protein [Pyrinomonadaceae bacterium]